MPTPTDYVRTAQEQYLETLKQGQKAVIDAVGLWAKSVEGYTAKAEAIPNAEQLPTPKEYVETTFSFVEKVIATQKELALAVLDAASPVLKNAGQKSSSSKSE